MMHSVGGAMLEFSPGTPTIDPGYRPENTRPINPKRPASVMILACCRARGDW